MDDWIPDPLPDLGNIHHLEVARAGARQAALIDACDLLNAFGCTASAHLIRTHLLHPRPRG